MNEYKKAKILKFTSLKRLLSLRIVVKMQFVIFCYITLQLTFEIIKAQSYYNSPYVHFEPSREKPLNSYDIHQLKNASPINYLNTIPVYDKEIKPYMKKSDISPSSYNTAQKHSYHTSDDWNHNVPPNNINLVPYLIYHSGNQISKNPNNNYLSGIITKVGNAVKETADENHNVFKNSIDSLVAAGVANANAGRDLIQSSLAFGTSFPRFGSKLFGQSDNSHQENGFNIKGFPL